MTTVYICEEWGYGDEDNTIHAVFDNEDAAKRLEATHITDSYTAFEVTSDFTIRDSIRQRYSYNVADSTFALVGTPTVAKMLDTGVSTARVSQHPTMGYTRWYQEPSPGAPQPMGSGRRSDPTGIVSLTISGARDAAEALAMAKQAIEEWKLEN